MDFPLLGLECRRVYQTHPSRVPAIPSPLAITISSYIFIYLHISSYIFHILPSSIKQSAIVTSSLILTICLSAPWVPLPGPAKRSVSWQTWLKRCKKRYVLYQKGHFELTLTMDRCHGMPWYAMSCASGLDRFGFSFFFRASREHRWQNSPGKGVDNVDRH
jgi:hypothetical protein